MNRTSLQLFSLAMLMLVTPFAWAHPGHIHGGFLPGFVHPFMGVDHLLAILAIGLWAGMAGGHARWQVPLSFMTAMALTAIAFVGASGIPLIENGIAVTVLLLGLVIASAVRLPAVAGMLLAMAFASFHGAAHGVEMLATASPLAYISGMLVASAMLHAVGVFIGTMSKTGVPALALRLAGVAIAGSGGYLLLAN